MVMSKLLWKPSEERIKKTNMYRFMQIINDKFGKNFDEYNPLYEWSVQNIPEFWATMWDFADIKASKAYEEVIDDVTKMPGAKWFSGAELNFAENLLRFRDDQVALIFKGEDQDARDHYRHARGLKPRSDLVFLLPGLRDQGGAGSLRPDQAQGDFHGERVFIQGEEIRLP